MKEVQLCELDAAPHKEGKTQGPGIYGNTQSTLKSITVQVGNDIEYVTHRVVLKVCCGFVPLITVEWAAK